MQRIVGRAAAQALVESDIPLPVGRDAQRILYAEGAIDSNACRCMNGQVQAEGALTLQLLCLGSDNLPFGMQAATQYAHTIPMADVREGMHCTVKPRLLDVRCALRDGRVRLEAVAELQSVATDDERVSVLSDIAGAPDLQRLHEETDVGELNMIGASTARLHEALPAPGVQQVLLANGSAQITGRELSGDSVTVSGTLFVVVLYLDEEGQFQQAAQQIPFQETVPVNADPRNCADLIVEADADDLSVTLSGEPGMLELDAAVFLKVYCIEQRHVTALADAYAPDAPLEIQQLMAEQMSVAGQAGRTLNYTEAVRIPEQLPEAFRPVFAAARPSVLGLVNSSGQLGVDGMFTTSVVYITDDGHVVGYEEDVPFAIVLDAPFMPDADVTVNLLEVRAAGGGRTLSVAYVVEVRALLRELVTLTLAVDAMPAAAPPRENGIFVAYAAEGETFWDIGKRFSVPAGRLREWNAEVAEPLGDGQPVMILSAAGKKR